MKLARLAIGSLGLSLLTLLALACSGEAGEGGPAYSSGGSSSSSGDGSPSGSAEGGASSSSSSGGSSSSSGGSSSSGSTDGGLAECVEIQSALVTLADKRGPCAETSENQEPLGFDSTTCNASFGAACAGAASAIDTYLSCLTAVPECGVGTEDAYNESIDACTDSLQNADSVSEGCLEAVMGD